MITPSTCDVPGWLHVQQRWKFRRRQHVLEYGSLPLPFCDTYICVCVCKLYMYIYIHQQRDVHTYICIHTYTYTCIYIYNIYIYIYMCMCIYWEKGGSARREEIKRVEGGGSYF
jgi:hypothetical protein